MLKQFVLHFRYFRASAIFVLNKLRSALPLAFKRVFLGFLILFITNSLSFSTRAQDPFVLVVDAGHGGHDNGTHGKKSVEKDVALAIALQFGHMVIDSMSDVKVIFTRDKDVFVELDERAAIANRNHANLFISIHVDGVKNTKVKGNSTFVMGLHRSEENLRVAERENSVIQKEKDYQSRYGDFDPNSPESYIKLALQQNLYLDLSLQIASYIQDNMEKKVKHTNRGVRQAGFLVLYKTTMPSILVETGFLTNPQEEIFLNSKSGQEKIARSIYLAFKKYKNEIDQKTISEKQIDEILQYNTLANDSSGIVFRVQLMSSTKAIDLNSSSLGGIENVVEVKEGSVYKYYSKAVREYDKIVNLQYEIRKKISDAFVVAFKDGERIPVKQAIKEIKK